MKILENRWIDVNVLVIFLVFKVKVKKRIIVEFRAMKCPCINGSNDLPIFK